MIIIMKYILINNHTGNSNKHPTVSMIRYHCNLLIFFITLLSGTNKVFMKNVDAATSPKTCFNAPQVGDSSSRDNRPSPSVKAKRIRPRIPVLQYHDDWVCVSKPAGMTVHRSHNTPRNQLVLSTTLKRQLARKVYPVHRLDHRTSGAILFAFDSSTCANLHKALTFGQSTIINGTMIEKSKKEYLALLRGDWKRKFGDQEEIVVDKPLDVKGVSKEARTVFKLLASYSGNEYKSQDITDSSFVSSACSLVLCSPETGRTHQIRRHANALGFPVIGDSAHGDSKVNRWWRENRKLNRLFLHCLYLDLPPLNAMRTVVENEIADTQSDELIIDPNEATKIQSKTKPFYSNDRIQCTAPIPEELSSIFSKHEDLSTLWNSAKQKEKRLNLSPVDDRGGTYGRNYRSRISK